MHTSRGRWGGRLTSRALPEADPDIDRLSGAQRRELAAIWLARAASERRVADAFEVICGALDELGGRSELTALASRAIDDEHRHAELSRLVASRFAGEELAPPPRLTLVVPDHAAARPGLLPTLHVLGHCAFNETFAGAFLEASLARARGELARAALRELLSDEIDHARIGWAHLASLDEQGRAEVARWLPAMARANLAMWRTTPRPYPTDPALHRHGAPAADEVEQALLGAVRDLIIPGLQHFGMPTAALRAWLAEGAPS